MVVPLALVVSVIAIMVEKPLLVYLVKVLKVEMEVENGILVVVVVLAVRVLLTLRMVALEFNIQLLAPIFGVAVAVALVIMVPAVTVELVAAVAAQTPFLLVD